MPEMRGLRLEARDFADLTRWRWVLTDASGAFVADHEVRLDPGHWQYEAFADLLGYLRWHVAPDRRHEDESRIVAEVGAWIGSQVLGPVAGTLARKRPATVRVVVPEGGGGAALPAAGARAHGWQAARRAGRYARDADRIGGRRGWQRPGW